MKRIENQRFDEERALYHLTDTEVINCEFAGEQDGESVLKEARNIKAEDCRFALRYPFWHNEDFSLKGVVLEEATRAALWYCKNGKILDTKMRGIKALRECDRIELCGCDIISDEFGWKCSRIKLSQGAVQSEYLFLDSSDIELTDIRMKGKYSFQYVDRLTISHSVLDTKDAFWHSKNTVVRDSVVKGEYVGWYSENLTLINCQIEGTQPFCYCKGLKLINCTMNNCDLSFEYSQVEADIIGHIDSVKNPLSGTITADSVGTVMLEDAVMPCSGSVILRDTHRT